MLSEEGVHSVFASLLQYANCVENTEYVSDILIWVNTLLKERPEVLKSDRSIPAISGFKSLFHNRISYKTLWFLYLRSWRHCASLMTFSTISDAKWKKRPKSRTVKPSARMAKMRSSTPMSLLKNLPMNRPPRNIPRSPMICRIPQRRGYTLSCFLFTSHINTTPMSFKAIFGHFKLNR